MTVAITFFAAAFVATCIIAAGLLYAPIVSLYFAVGLIGAAVLALAIFGKVE